MMIRERTNEPAMSYEAFRRVKEGAGVVICCLPTPPTAACGPHVFVRTGASLEGSPPALPLHGHCGLPKGTGASRIVSAAPGPALCLAPTTHTP